MCNLRIQHLHNLDINSKTYDPLGKKIVMECPNVKLTDSLKCNYDACFLPLQVYHEHMTYHREAILLQKTKIKQQKHRKTGKSDCTADNEYPLA